MLVNVYLAPRVARPEPEAMGVKASNTFASSHPVHLALDAGETVAITLLVTPFVPQGVPPDDQRLLPVHQGVPPNS